MDEAARVGIPFGGVRNLALRAAVAPFHTIALPATSMALLDAVTLLHVLAAAVGVGAAVAADTIFLGSIRNRHVSHDQFVLVTASSKVVLAGLAVLVLTGIVLLWDDWDTWDSAHFQVKVTAVVVLMINGMVFHAKVIPFLAGHRHDPLPEHMLASRQWLFAITGAISGVSWFATLILAVVGPVEMSYLVLVGIYVGAMGLAAAAGYLVLSHLILWDKSKKEAAEHSKDVSTGKSLSMVVMGILLVLLLAAIAMAVGAAG